MEQLEEKIRSLSPELRREAEDFVEFLLSKNECRPRGKMKLSWRGALRDERDQHTSVELQHKLHQSWAG